MAIQVVGALWDNDSAVIQVPKQFCRFRMFAPSFKEVVDHRLLGPKGVLATLHVNQGERGVENEVFPT